MKNQNHRGRTLKIAIFALILSFGLASRTVVFGSDNEIEFKGRITQIERTSSTAARLTVSLSTPSSGGPQTVVLVDDMTKIVKAGDVERSLDDLSVGQFIEARGIFTSKGIDARKFEIQAEKEAENEFRIRGEVESMDLSSGTARLSIGGSSISVTASAHIRHRGDNQELRPDDLIAGQPVDVDGFMQNGQLIVTQVEVGQKMEDQAELELHGTITAINGNNLTIEMAKQPSISVVITRTDATRVEGSLSVGVDVEVKGMMARDFSIVAQKIEVEGAVEAEIEHAGGDDHGGAGDAANNAPQNVSREIQLSAVGIAPKEAEGDAEVEFESQEGSVAQKLNVKGDKLAPNSTFSVAVTVNGGSVNVGSFMTDNRGRGELALQCGSTCPGFSSVLDIHAVQVLSGGSAVLQGSF
ncbi:MAG: DUF5666 domain-containing protein [Acidobacteriia bacterium]|nr:DUF5666 domain-containing protein [Terriglobia bacterium]